MVDEVGPEFLLAHRPSVPEEDPSIFSKPPFSRNVFPFQIRGRSRKRGRFPFFDGADLIQCPSRNVPLVSSRPRRPLFLVDLRPFSLPFHPFSSYLHPRNRTVCRGAPLLPRGRSLPRGSSFSSPPPPHRLDRHLPFPSLSLPDIPSRYRCLVVPSSTVHAPPGRRVAPRHKSTLCRTRHASHVRGT